MINKHPLGDLSLAKFLKDYWQKKPVVIRNAIDDFQAIISADELAGLACEEEVESRLIIQQHDTTPWAMKHGPFTADEFSALPDSHWTLLVQAVDHWHPAASALLKKFDFIPQWRIDDLMVSYATKGGGVGPLYDNYDVFLLQASGSRQWEYGGIFNEKSARTDNDELMLLEDWKAEHSVTLNPGDMLYIPPNVGHNGVALTDDCTTYSIGFRAPSHSDALINFTDFVAHDLASELRYQDPDLTAQKHSAQMSNVAIEKVRAILRQYIDQPGLVEQWFGCYMTEHKYQEQQQAFYLDNAVDEIIDAMQDANTLCKIPGTRLAFQLRDNNQKNAMLLFINGMCCQITQDEQQFVIDLCELDEIDINTVKQSPERLKLLANLIKIGAYEIR